MNLKGLYERNVGCYLLLLFYLGMHALKASAVAYMDLRVKEDTLVL